MSDALNPRMTMFCLTTALLGVAAASCSSEGGGGTGGTASSSSNHLYNHGYVARIEAFRKDLIKRAQGRETSQPAIPPAGEGDAWRRALLARTQEAHDGGLITDGAARALLELAPGEPLPAVAVRQVA